MVIGVFSLFFFVSFSRNSKFYWSFQRTSSLSIHFLSFFSVVSFIKCTLTFMVSLLLLALGLLYSFLSSWGGSLDYWFETFPHFEWQTKCYNLTFWYGFTCVHPQFWYVIFSFSLSPMYLQISFDTSSLTYGLFKRASLVSRCLEIFLLFFCYWYLVWFRYSRRTRCVWSQLFCFWGLLFFSPGYSLSWYMFCGQLENNT